MALHDVTDAQAAALLHLLSGGLNAELQPLTTEPVVVGTYAWPAITNERVPQLGHPALAVWREEDQLVERTMQRAEHLVTWRIDYALPATSLDYVGARWALLAKVWEKAVALLEAGKHPSVSGGARVLVDAGFTELVIDRQFPRARNIELADPKGLYPAFQARVRMQHREEPDLGLPVVSLHTKVFPSALPEDEREAFAAQLHLPPATVALPALPAGLVGLWELQHALVDDDGHVTGVPDLSGHGNHLPVVGSGAEITLAVAGDYGGRAVGVFAGGRYLYRAAFAAGQVSQPTTVLWLGEWTGLGVAHDRGGGGQHIMARDDGSFAGVDGRIVLDAGASAVLDVFVPEGAPVATLTTFAGAASTFRHGSDWSTPVSADAGTDPLDGFTLGATREGDAPLTGRIALAAAWDHELDAAERAQVAEYLASFGQAITL